MATDINKPFQESYSLFSGAVIWFVLSRTNITPRQQINQADFNTEKQ
jgi:hypothetical protein